MVLSAQLLGPVVRPGPDRRSDRHEPDLRTGGERRGAGLGHRLPGTTPTTGGTQTQGLQERGQYISEIQGLQERGQYMSQTQGLQERGQYISQTQGVQERGQYISQTQGVQERGQYISEIQGVQERGQYIL